ncbi:MAG: hydantoinase/oxoprolinase N-terminal domain-containing protein [Bdellovibrio sp.]
MQNSFLLGVSIGESFAEYSLLHDAEPVAEKRVYLSRENLKNSLQQFVLELGDKKPAFAFISFRLPKKLLSFYLTGSVAHVTTEGFEQWLNICGKSTNTLTNKELLFSVSERTLADGTIEKALNLSDLEPIAEKLKLTECKKVCLHFLHSSMNSTHVDMAGAFFQEKGFEVFIPEKTDNPHEVSRWNKNILNATVSGVFADRKADVLSALEGVIEAKNIFFLDSDGNLLMDEKPSKLGSLFSSSTALGLYFSKQKASVLYLGLENFMLISSSSWTSLWESPWGTVEVPHLKIKELNIQPTLGIGLNGFSRFDFTTHQEGWEPGPMFLGRGQKLSLLDLWAENNKLIHLPGLKDRFSAQGIQRFKNSLYALSKISSTKDTELDHLTKEMQSLTLQRLAIEALLHRESEKLIVTGPLANVFGNAFKKDANTTIDSQGFRESQATALFGFKALQETL